MKHPASGGRRKLVIVAAGGAAAAAAGFSACQGEAAGDRALHFASLAAAREELDRLALAPTSSSGTAWSWAQTLTHCAQSIEYSMSGFPQMKPELFQRTVGSAAISVFSWRGRMTHDLAEPIPGAPRLDAQAPPGPALERLRAAIQAFLQWPGPLRPHFAYGELARPQYELAHAMHLANHLSAYRAAT
jgi:hypothetical protein